MQQKQHLQLPEEPGKQRIKLENMLAALGHSLDLKFHDYTSARSDKEAEWERAIEQYEGEWDRDDLEKIEQALGRSSSSDPITVNITRPKTNVCIARLQDIQFPTGGDFNFYLRPADLNPEQKKAAEMQEPDPQMQQEVIAAGAPLQNVPSPAQLVGEIQAANIERCPKMERQLRKRMIEANYGRKARYAIEDLCILGTAVIKGPTIQHRKVKQYEGKTTTDGTPVQVLNERYEEAPDVERVDPLYYFPDPSARLPEEIADAYELHPMGSRELIELAKNPAYIKENIRLALEGDPDVDEIPDIVQRAYRSKSNNAVNSKYWVREYRGQLDKQVLFEAGMIDEEDKDDALVRFYGEVWYVNKKVIRVSLSHIDGEDQLPYSVAVYEKDPNSVFGHGVPYLLRDAQRTVNSAYLMLLDNASLTAGPQIVINKEMIEPASRDGDYSIRPMKVWHMTEYGVDVREAIQFIDIPAQMEGLGRIIDSAMQFADVESSTPMMQQGEMPAGNNTTTGLAMVMSATNIIQKAASMNWDDYITRPLVERFYHYEMQHGEDDSVKGDYSVEVGGATERVEAQIRAQEIERLIGLAGSNPEFMMHVDPAKAFRALTDNTRTGDILRTLAEVEQLKQQQAQQAEQQQQSDPDFLKAQAAMITAQATRDRAAAEAQLNNARQEMQAMETQARYQGFLAEAQARQNEASLNYQLGLAKLAMEREMSVSELQNQLQVKDMEHAMQLQLKEIDFAKMEREIQVKNEYGTGI